MDIKILPVKGYECYYAVNNVGEVFRINETREFINGKIVFTPLYEKLRLGSHPDGYIGINLCTNSVQKRKLVHRLVAEAFISNSNNYSQVNHKDGNRMNNHVENLEWCNNSMNQIHRTYILKSHNVLGKFGGNAPKAIKINQLDKDTGEIIKTWNCIKDAIEAGAASTMVCRALKDSTKTCKGYRWEKIK